MIATSLASAARPFWRLLDHYNIDPAYVFREAGLDPALMDEPRERYNVGRRAAAWKTAEELIDDPCFGLKIAAFWSPTDLHALGYAFLASSTLRTALERLCRYVHVVNDVVGYELVDDREDSLHESPHPQPETLGAGDELLQTPRSRSPGACRAVRLRPVHLP